MVRRRQILALAEDVILYILDILHQQRDILSLKNASLTCTEWRHFSRIRLFRKVNIGVPPSSKNSKKSIMSRTRPECCSLNLFSRDLQGFAVYVQELVVPNLHLDPSDPTSFSHLYDLHRALEQLPSLRSLHVQIMEWIPSANLGFSSFFRPTTPPSILSRGTIPLLKKFQPPRLPFHSLDPIHLERLTLFSADNRLHPMLLFDFLTLFGRIGSLNVEELAQAGPAPAILQDTSFSPTESGILSEFEDYSRLEVSSLKIGKGVHDSVRCLLLDTLTRAQKARQTIISADVACASLKSVRCYSELLQACGGALTGCVLDVNQFARAYVEADSGRMHVGPGYWEHFKSLSACTNLSSLTFRLRPRDSSASVDYRNQNLASFGSTLDLIKLASSTCPAVSRVTLILWYYNRIPQLVTRERLREDLDWDQTQAALKSFKGLEEVRVEVLFPSGKERDPGMMESIKTRYQDFILGGLESLGETTRVVVSVSKWTLGYMDSF